MILLGTAREIGGRVAVCLESAGASRVALVGGARRGCAVVDEVSFLACDIAPHILEGALAMTSEALRLEDVRERRDGLTAYFPNGCRFRVRVVNRPQWTGALLRETSDGAHLAWLGRCARRRGLSLKSVLAAARDERGVYRALGLPPVPPELREGARRRIPRGLVESARISGVFHVHTDWSDGSDSIVTMARAASGADFRFLGISDHSQAATYANGLDGERLAEQAAALAIARREVPEVTLLHGVEVDILPDGSLDLPDDVLASLDFVIASVHTRHNMGPPEMTRRILRAVSHPLVTMLGHPTGRLLAGKGGYRFDVAAVAAQAARNDTYLEINANPHRLDLPEELVRVAAHSGARFVVNPDAHTPRGLTDTLLGVAVARRAGLARGQILNAENPRAVLARLEARKAVALQRLGRAAAE